MADAEAVYEAVTRPTMRFVPVKSAERQSVLVHHRARDLLMRQRTMLLNAVRGHLAEFGLITQQGPRKVMEMIARLQNDKVPELPEIACSSVLRLDVQLEALVHEIHQLARVLRVLHRQDAASQRLETISGIGIISPTAPRKCTGYVRVQIRAPVRRTSWCTLSALELERSVELGLRM